MPATPLVTVVWGLRVGDCSSLYSIHSRKKTKKKDYVLITIVFNRLWPWKRSAKTSMNDESESEFSWERKSINLFSELSWTDMHVNIMRCMESDSGDDDDDGDNKKQRREQWKKRHKGTRATNRSIFRRADVVKRRCIQWVSSYSLPQCLEAPALLCIYAQVIIHKKKCHLFSLFLHPVCPTSSDQWALMSIISLMSSSSKFHETTSIINKTTLSINIKIFWL